MKECIRRKAEERKKRQELCVKELGGDLGCGVFAVGGWKARATGTERGL